jgi:hypothetical protein
MNDNNKPAHLTLAESEETGRTWPHGEREGARAVPNLGKTHARRVPAMTDDTRAWITGVLDDEYNRGLHEGRMSMLDSAMKREVTMFVLGIAAAVAAQFLWSWVTH